VPRATTRSRPARRPRGHVRVRALRWDDFPELVRGYWHLYDERDRGKPHGITLFGEKPTLAEEVDWFASLYRRVLLGDAICVVAEVAGRVVGQCSIGRVGRTADAENGHVGLLGILVEHGYRRRGVGRALMRAALSRARSRFEVVKLSVFANNYGAKRLYEQLGFRLTGSIPRAVRRRGAFIDEEHMALVFDRRPGHRENR